MNLSAESTELLKLYSVALFVHNATDDWSAPELNVALLFCVLLQFFKSDAVWPTLLAITLTLPSQILSFPRQANHSNLELFASFAICALVIARSRKSLYLDLPRLCRGATVTIYWLAAFHKLNADFLNPEVSAANWLHHGLLVNDLEICHQVHPLLKQISPLLTLAFELLCPVFLLAKRTRALAVIVMFVFHSYLNLAGFSNFSSLMTVLLVGSIIDGLPAQALRFIVKLIQASGVLCGIWVYLAYRVSIVETRLVPLVDGAIFSVGTIATAGAIYMWFRITSQREEKRSHCSCRLQNSLQYGIPVALCIWSLQPYVGLSTSGNLTMFSNLTTEVSQNNHLLVPTAYTKIVSFEEDKIRILDLPGELRFDSQEDIVFFDLPRIEFAFLIDKWSKDFEQPLPARIEYRGKTLVIADLRTSEFNRSQWWYRFFHYRKLQRTRPIKARW